MLRIPINWDTDTFSGPDEPKLRLELPYTPYKTIGVVGSRRQGIEVESLARIEPEAGDYNFDGKFDTSDLIEWRKAFGRFSATLFIRGREWRRLCRCRLCYLAGGIESSRAFTSPSVPEPPAQISAAVTTLILILLRGERIPCKRFAKAYPARF